MKIFSQGYVFHPDGIVDAKDLLCYSGSQDVDVLIIGCDNIEQLEENIRILSNCNFDDFRERNIKLEKFANKFTKRGCFFRNEFGNYGSHEDLEKFTDYIPA